MTDRTEAVNPVLRFEAGTEALDCYGYKSTADTLKGLEQTVRPTEVEAYKYNGSSSEPLPWTGGGTSKDS